ncbi:MAG TPA: hypothetical protein VIQ01_11225 [Burkholderiales bacterium]
MNVLMEILVIAMQLFSLGVLVYGLVLSLDNGLQDTLEEVRACFGRTGSIRRPATA